MKTFDLTGAADFLKVDPSTVKRRAGRGEIIGAKAGRSWVFREEDLDTYLRELAISQTEARKSDQVKEAMAQLKKMGLVRRRPLPVLQQHVGI